jgi:hypothetical protein
LFDVAGQLDPATPCPFVTGPSTVATWLWHIAGETCIHRSDVEHALGLDVSRCGADAGVDLLQWSVLFRIMVASRRAGGPPATIRCEAIDGNEVAVIGDGPPVATVAGAGQDLALRLWNRPHGPLTGDGEAMSAWADIQTISPLS